MQDISQDGTAELAARLGPRGWLTAPGDIEPYCRDWRGLYHGRALAVARPADAEETALVIRTCGELGWGVVPQGGNTSLVGGATPDAGGRQIVLSTSRMNRVRAIDPLGMTMVAEAGVVLRTAQQAAADVNRLLPLSIAAEGSAQIGGVLAANAGGNATLRYGNARDLVLGLEAVLPDGSIWNGLRSLRKDNTGYCLRQLLLGSEGTLGVITAAVLQLAPRPRRAETALLAVPSPRAALDLLARLRDHDPAALSAFEYMSGAGMALVLRHIEGATLPLAEAAPHYVLAELTTPRLDADLRAGLETVLEAALEAGTVTDAALAESEAQRAALWRLREEHTEAQKRAGASVKNDVSVPIAAIPELLERAAAACERVAPGVRVAPFGHLGDGNIHFNLVQPAGADGEAFLARAEALMEAVNGVVRDLDGSFSAEHGVGQLKTGLLEAWRGGAELEAMRRIKAALDPQGIMNPGKVLAVGGL